MPAWTRISREGLLRAGVDVCTAALYGSFAWAHWVAFRQHPRPSLAIMVVLEAIFAGFLVTRRPPGGTSHSAWDWLATAAGTLAPLLLRPASRAADVAAGEGLQIAGLVLAVAAVLSLNRSIGLVPAFRGVKTGGPYRLVRHPIYLAYTLSQVGYIASNFTLRNVLVAAAALALQLARIANEERFLAGYPEYRTYQARTRWRLLPFVY